MTKVICDRCGKGMCEKITVPIEIIKELQVHQIFHSGCELDLCKDCYNEYLNQMREFMKLNRKDDFAF